MLNEKQTERMLGKLKRFAETIEPMIFDSIGEIDFKAYQTYERLNSIPDGSLFKDIERGFTWGGEGAYCWFTGQYLVPAAYAGRPLFIYPKIDGYEGMLWVNGKASGIFANKIQRKGHGNHYCDLLMLNPSPSQIINIAIEYYAGHYVPGEFPLEDRDIPSFNFEYNGALICVKNYEIQDFYFDLCTLNELAEHMPHNSFRRNEVVNCLYDVFNTVYLSPDDVDIHSFMTAIRTASAIMKRALAVKNGDDAPFAGLTGHSHMDTAWLWHVGETVKKCARTYSNQLSLMEEYPEYRFIQSSSCHSDFIRRFYPELFERMTEKIKEGRYEPNGGVWVECDCNITGGESMIRQFLWGQRFTRKYFNYTSDCFWLPDTFGYSAAIPQIMKGCDVKYFLTTKIGWNDTNDFPYDTFRWEGIDGTGVFAHFNTTHHFPDAADIMDRVGQLKQKTVNNKRYLSYGYGDGGGGPQFEMIELARRCKDLNGVPKSEHMSCSEFMKELEKTSVNPNTYRGELYLEIHRGTLTNQHNIKRNNRKAETALRALEYFTVNRAVLNNEVADAAEITPLYEVLLLNQFHDILPGTCINKAHEECKSQMTKLLNDAKNAITELTAAPGENSISFINTLSFERDDVIFAPYREGYIVSGGYAQQLYTDLDGNKKLLIAGVKIPAMSAVSLELIPGAPEAACPFKVDGDNLDTPHARILFDQKGRIASFIDKDVQRQLRGEGCDLNTFLLAEDLPTAWDNWDIDADLESKFRDTSTLISREIVSVGPVAFIIRSAYKISDKSTIKQDMIFFAHSREVRFDTAIDWNDDHRFLKVAFDTNVFEDFARQEIQFGYLKRPTTRNTSIEQAKFEVLNHKYTDISESRFGAAVLNDCKYGISLKPGSMRLSLHKGGIRPDYKGDKDGIHRCVYSFLPHDGGFSSENVTQPAYMLNNPVIVSDGIFTSAGLARVSESNIIVETIKPCEDAEKAYIVRLYEAEGAHTSCMFTPCASANRLELTNMLEESKGILNYDSAGCHLNFKPFEIKTVKVYYS